MPGWSHGYRAAPVRCRLTPGRISSLLGTDGLRCFICLSTNALSWTLPREGHRMVEDAQRHGADVAILENRAPALSCSSDDGNRNEAGA